MTVIERIRREHENNEGPWVDSLIGAFLVHVHRKIPTDKRASDDRYSSSVLLNYIPEELEVLYAKYQVEKDLIFNQRKETP